MRIIYEDLSSFSIKLVIYQNTTNYHDFLNKDFVTQEILSDSNTSSNGGTNSQHQQPSVTKNEFEVFR